MPAPMFWEDDPDGWDQIQIGTVPPFGIAAITVRKAQQNDPKKVTGTTDTKITHLGVEPAQVFITIRMWLQEHLDGYQKVVELLEPRDGKVPDAQKVAHPLLAIHRIRELYFVLIEPPKPSTVKGVWECTLVAQEWRPDLNKNSLGDVKTKPSDEPQIGGSYGATKPRTPPSKQSAAP